MGATAGGVEVAARGRSRDWEPQRTGIIVAVAAAAVALEVALEVVVEGRHRLEAATETGEDGVVTMEAQLLV